MASQPENSKALRRLLETSHIPVTSTFHQAAGAVNQDNFFASPAGLGCLTTRPGPSFAAACRPGDLARLQPGGIDEPAMWNSGNATLVHIDVLPAYEERTTPDVELVGDIAGTSSTSWRKISIIGWCSPRQRRRRSSATASTSELLTRRGAQLNQFALHPLRIVRAMQDIVNSDVTADRGHGYLHIWIARYLYQLPAPAR
ncbi:hypothetical protein MJ584_15890 [Klebsiella pneumoniae]|nr:hypothetical protein MJ584_15890 [Klebsiella pneumoniae]